MITDTASDYLTIDRRPLINRYGREQNASTTPVTELAADHEAIRDANSRGTKMRFKAKCSACNIFYLVFRLSPC